MVIITASKRTGILGGSFDPVHLGHIGLAEDAINEADLDNVIFIPAAHQPFKLDRNVTSGEDRLSMLRLAVMGRERLEISEYELEAEGISYTYLTMRAMKQLLGSDTKLFFITGTDSFLKIEQWKNSSELLLNYSFIIGRRPGYKEEELESCISELRRKYGTEIIKIRSNMPDVSSTEVRRKIVAGESVEEMVPEPVERYIEKNGLYR